MNYYARFNKNLDIDGNTYFKVSDNTNKTRYYICDEDEESYYICENPNCIYSNIVCKMNKIHENDIFIVVEE